MNSLFYKLMGSILGIKKGELAKALLSFLYFYLTITSYYILKPARNSLYIEFLGADRIPYVVMFIAITSLPIMAAYAYFVRKYENNKVVSGFLGLAVVSLILFRWGFQIEGASWLPGMVSFAFYVWLTLFSSIAVMQFWVLANDVFDVQSAKRLYGFVGAGGILGGISGGLIAMQAKRLGTENLLLVSAVYLVGMLVLYNYIWFKERTRFEAETHEPKEKVKASKESWQILRHSKYLIWVLLIIAFSKIVTSQTEWQYNKFVEFSMGAVDDRTVFFGKIIAYLSFVALFIQLFLTSRVLKKFNFQGALLPLPLGLLAGALLVLVHPVLAVAAILKITEGSTRYSINQTASNYLYLPVPRSVRHKVKPVFDVSVYQVAKGIGGFLTFIYIFGATRIFGLSGLGLARFGSVFNLALIVLWLFVIIMLKKEYPNEIRRFLKSSKEIDNQDRKKSALVLNKYFEKTDDQLMQSYKDMLQDINFKGSSVRLAVCVALYEAGLESASVKRMIEDIVKEDNVELRDYFAESKSGADALLNDLASRNDVNDRYASIKALNKARKENVEIDFDRDLILKQLDHEITEYYRTFSVFTLYETVQNRKGSAHEKDVLYSAIHNTLDNIFERLFRLMGLLYNPVDIHLIYKGMINGNVYIRSNALELFDNIVDAEIKKKVLPILDGELSLFGQSKARVSSLTIDSDGLDVLKEGLRSEDNWIVLSSILIILKLELTDLYSDLRKSVKGREGVLKDAASFVDEYIRERGEERIA